MNLSFRLPRRSAFGPTAAFMILPFAGLWSQDAVKQTQSLLQEWIQTEKQISADRSEWAVERAVIEDTVDFMSEEIERLEGVIAEAAESASAGERKRTALEAEEAKLTAVTTALEETIGTYESQILALSKTWPKTFLASIRRPLDRIPEEEEASKAAPTMRLQNVISILLAFDKFNSVVTKDLEVHEIEGTSREVTTLYYGMAFAYFVDGSGTYAGYGHPAPSGEGWEWTADPALAPAVSDLVGVFEQTQEAAFVAVPAKIVTP